MTTSPYLKKALDFSVVVPVYNSAATLEELFAKIKQVFEYTRKTFEVVFVDDHCSDHSWHVLSQLHELYPNLVVAIRLSRNFGQHNAVMCGLSHSRGNLVITIDDDLQTPPEEILKLVAKFEETRSDVVYGTYAIKKHSALRNLASSIIRMIIKITFKTDINVTSFRLLTRALVDRIKNHKQAFVYIEGLFYWHTADVAHIEVRHEERQKGRSGYTFKKLLILSLNLFFNFTTYPLRLIVFLGLGGSAVSFIVGLIFVIRKMTLDVPLGYTSIIVAILFMGCVQLSALGIIGEYLTRLYSLNNDKPQYSIKETLGGIA